MAVSTIAMLLLAYGPWAHLGPPLVYVHSRAEGEDRELVVAHADGYRTTGRMQFGGAWWTFDLEATSQGGGLRVRSESSSVQNDVSCDVTLKDGTCVDTAAASGAPRFRFPADGPPFVYDYRLAACYLPVGRALVGPGSNAAEDALGRTFVAVDVIGHRSTLFHVEQVDRLDWRGQPLWRVTLRATDEVVRCVFDDRGVPWRVDAANADLHAVLAGKEESPLADIVSTSVDDGGWRHYISPRRYATVEEKRQMIPMRDGVHLALDVFRPRQEGRFPTILVRTPYHRVGESMSREAVFPSRGYVLVVQDVRGRGQSEGDFEPLIHEERDGSDTIDWIAAQPWSDGNVGMIGSSYVGWVQWFAAMSGNPHLKAMVPIVCPPDPEENFPYEGGVPLMAVAWWGAVLDELDTGSVFGPMPDYDWNEVFSVLPLSEVDRAVECERPWVDEWFRHPPHDPYWEARRFHPAIPRIAVPTLHVSGWFDGDQPGALLNFRAMSDRGPPSVREHQYLIMGPWGHGVNISRRLGDVDFGDDAIIDLDRICLRFFDRYLKGIENGIDHEDRVLLFTLGDNSWRRTSDWPPPDTSPTDVFLGGSGDARRWDGSGRLVSSPPAAADTPPFVFRYDPLDLLEPDVDFNDVLGASATQDLSTLPDRLDVLDFTSPPLAEDVVLTGAFRARLFVSSDAADTDFAVALHRLTEDGGQYAVASGIQRLRYRRGLVDEPVPPNEVVEVEVDMWASSIRLKAGERLRVQVSSSQWPGMARNLNTLESPFTATEAVVATNRVFHDASRPSRLILPVASPTRLFFVKE